MKVSDLLNKLQKLNQDAEVKIASFHFDDQPKQHFGETIFNDEGKQYSNIVSAWVDDLSLVLTTSESKEILLFETNAANNTLSFKNTIEYRIKQLQRRCSKLDPELTFINLSFTSKHPKRTDEKATDAITTSNYEAKIDKVDVAFENDQFIFKLVHHVKNGIGCLDQLILPSITGLENLIDVLFLLEKNK